MTDHRQRVESESLEKKSWLCRQTRNNNEFTAVQEKPSNYHQVQIFFFIRMMKGTAHLYLCHASAFFYLQVCLCRRRRTRVYEIGHK